MKIFYFVSLVAVMVFFNACSTAQVMTPEEIDAKAIAPSAENNLFSPPKNGYARLIMYRKSAFFGAYVSHSVLLQYNPLLENGKYKYIKEDIDRALCKIKSNSSCIVNIKAGQPVVLTYAGQDDKENKAVLFTPRNQHIYCSDIEMKWGVWLGQFQFNFRDKDTCLKEYQEVYKPKHRDYQDKWFNGLIEKGDKRAYKE